MARFPQTERPTERKKQREVSLLAHSLEYFAAKAAKISIFQYVEADIFSTFLSNFYIL